MPRYYCDYCDTYLTHDSPSVRKQHNAGYKHKANVRSYYQQFEEQQTQSLIDQRIKEHLGQTAAFQQVGVAYNHLVAQRPAIPVLPPPRLPFAGNPQVPGSQPLMPGIRPLLPRPVPGAPGYVSAPTMPPMVPPPGAPLVPGQANTIPRPPTLAPHQQLLEALQLQLPMVLPLWFHQQFIKPIHPHPQLEVMIVTMPMLKLLRAITDVVKLFSLHNSIYIGVL